MSITTSRSIGGNTGLGLLALMALALVAGEVRDQGARALPGSAVSTAPATPAPRLLFEQSDTTRDTLVRGAIRELRVIPATIDQRIDLNWTPDEYLLEEYRRTGM